MATVISGADAKRKLHSVGPPVPTVELRIMDRRRRVLGVGETGEVCVRGPILMKGYWNKPEATAEAIDATGSSTPGTSATSTTRATSPSPTARRT